MSDKNDTTKNSTPPTPEAHGHREEKGSGEPSPTAADKQQQLTLDEQPDEQRPEDGDPAEQRGPAEQGDLHEVRAIIEAILFASDEPLTRETIEASLPDYPETVIKSALENLRFEYSGQHRGIHLAEVAGGYQLRTNPDFKDHILKMYEARPRKLSRAAMETLAIIAYQQPLTRADVEEIRGVDSSGVIRTLEEHDLVQTIGRLDDLGRPHIYGTTERFLEFFSLDSLADLPTLDDTELEAIEEMYAEELAEAEAADKAQQADDDAE
ncbi:SMC-Scp complex subunit ScpB [Persicimonas caeni]|uniref:SMC-Scp complex subunit ScpB n=1 Tax=Persicimonas caeni TaxID=2292766 RepID=A0A4Y6PNN7_PERCE|nr:SMC-Scp complex subunit ScpB [Persicimonas caeni]QDG49922.1 SMC-Scp complex subunit ScpB [Persicimonas caeni]QED31143.1 SMC-Scp complex subunit ScpB [Persicimonas caeni]